jgi:hypothetical protein
MELPTAVRYFGAIALLTSADLPIAQWRPLLVLYNFIFVLPPPGPLNGPRRFREANGRATRSSGSVCRRARETMLWVFGSVGGALLVSSVVEYVASYVIRR